MWINAHPGIQTHNLLNTSLLPQPLDLGSRLKSTFQQANVNLI